MITMMAQNQKGRNVQPDLQVNHAPAGPRHVVRWPVSPLHDLQLTASFVVGLAELARSGDIVLDLEILPDRHVAPHVMYWIVRETRSGRECCFAFDVYDRSDRFDMATLGRANVYFKRNFSRSGLEAVPQRLRSRIEPAGMTFGCRTRASNGLLVRAAATSFRAHLAAFGLPGLNSALRRLWQDFNLIRGFPDASVWERTPDDPVHEQVVFQTRVWTPEPDPAIDRTRVNAERIALVRALRSAFGSGDLVGLIHTEFAERIAPDALLSRKVSRIEYAQQLRTSLISVNSHGLDGSGGFKIGESLAAGVALVSQPFHFELPEPLLPDVNYLPYETPEQCVAQCRRLLAERSLANRLRSANLEYYWRNVQPAAHARQVLARAFSSDESQASPVTGMNG